MMTWLSWYLVLSSIITFAYIIRFPSRMKPVDNLIGSILVALLAGWLLWLPAMVVFYGRLKDGHDGSDC